ncbi:hypothetical protein [Chitinophaga sp. RAB17]|uniref:hypothetical protein n=1 Tax=Chitinophaga sp. RAB17 TaxID=3233049 RepID=UPI003F8E395A
MNRNTSLLFAAILLSSTSLYAQEKKAADTSKVHFKPPVIKKDKAASPSTKASAVKFKPPVIKENAGKTGTKQEASPEVKFAPPVIKKDARKTNKKPVPPPPALPPSNN